MQADKVKAYHNMADCPNWDLKRVHATGYLTCYTGYTVIVLRIRAFIGLFVSVWLMQYQTLFILLMDTFFQESNE